MNLKNIEPIQSILNQKDYNCTFTFPCFQDVYNSLTRGVKPMARREPETGPPSNVRNSWCHIENCRKFFKNSLRESKKTYWKYWSHLYFIHSFIGSLTITLVLKMEIQQRVGGRTPLIGLFGSSSENITAITVAKCARTSEMELTPTFASHFLKGTRAPGASSINALDIMHVSWDYMAILCLRTQAVNFFEIYCVSSTILRALFSILLPNITL